MKTYTIATNPAGLLIACADQHYGIDHAVRDEQEKTGLAFQDLIYTSGLTLTDDLRDGDEVVFESGKLGWLMNADESQFIYAVRRSA